MSKNLQTYQGIDNMGSAKLIIVLMIAGASFGGYQYVQNLQNTLQVAIENNTKLETAVATNEETISSLQEDYNKIQQELQQVNEEFSAARKQNNLLRDRLSDIDLGLLAQTKPSSVERAINQGTTNATRCFEILSGAALTDQEKEAINGKDFNKECPWLWPGSNTVTTE